MSQLAVWLLLFLVSDVPELEPTPRNKKCPTTTTGWCFGFRSILERRSTPRPLSDCKHVQMTADPVTRDAGEPVSCEDIDPPGAAGGILPPCAKLHPQIQSSAFSTTTKKKSLLEFLLICLNVSKSFCTTLFRFRRSPPQIA